ncbi:extracellular catalytic domain type 2 short-chain-length polyhydroxyalkanoate depolymerase [Bradyrhizobium sp.]|jgi:poly(3-hydroxybutyrate) depolymerase|uniref:extracellular catalytic domain type 2 short-chain-length polyhydroxyalkanoate depolymerase n=1 Tax=Bradyrhizobium sp. TaxID=376 RepID=UPI003C3B846D
MNLGGVHGILKALAFAGSIAATPLAAEPLALNSYNAAIAETSVSGISSGAFMAVQFGTAWSSVIKGVGVVAGGPFWCAEADADDAITGYWGPLWRATGSCMKGPPSGLNVSDFVSKADLKSASGDIDPVSNLKEQKIYLFHGYNDAVVAKAVADAAAEFYRHYLGENNRGNLFYQTTIGAGHSLVVIDDAQKNNSLGACNANDSPFIDQCGYDQAGIILQHIYGALNPPNRGQLEGSLKRFDQSIYTKPDEPEGLSLGDAGYLFVPEECQRGDRCRIHIAFHGCEQDSGDIDQRFVEYTGYNAWADTNHLIVLYPQTRSSSILPYNPQACWDWWSYIDHSDGYVTKSGAQIRTIKAMLDTLTSGTKPLTTPVVTSTAAPPPLVVDTSDTCVDLAWKQVEGAVTFRISRASADGQFSVVGETSGFSFADANLAPESNYRWHLSVVVNGVEGATSADVTTTTRATPAPCDAPGSCPTGK